MKQTMWVIGVLVLLAGCQNVPYRSAGFSDGPDCKSLYNRIDDLDDEDEKISDEDRNSHCWRRAHEARDRHDLLFVEFDDQGWVQGSGSSERKGRAAGGNPDGDYLDEFERQLNTLHERYKHRGLTLVVFVHGWHHNARADDENVRDFRHLLGEVAHAENRMTGDELGRRVVGLYVGWRGESLRLPYVNSLTFWDRKAVAEHVAQGSVREMFARLDRLRDESRRADGQPGTRLLTIGHSFGGLLVYNALSGELLRAAAHSDGNHSAARLGDLVVIVNPAIEGTRYEPLLAAGQRPKEYRTDQLPVVVIATSKADWATGLAFPAARVFSTLFESQTWVQWLAGINTVGHSDRYTTHHLEKCADKDVDCKNACRQAEPESRRYQKSATLTKNKPAMDKRLEIEYRHMLPMAERGATTKEYFCGQMQLTATDKWTPVNNPFWVVSTSGDIMKGHNDIFNNYFVGFVRQLYLGILAQEKAAKATGKRN